MNAQGTLFIAEAGVNHNGSLETAEKLIEVAAACGSDVVKFQTFKAATLVTAGARKADYQTVTTGAHENQLQMLKRLELSRQDHFHLARLCESRGIEFLSTAFDVDSLSFLVEEVGIRRIKVPSGEITNAPLLLKVSQYGLPIILSTGMATLGDIENALGVIAFGLLRGSESPSRQGFLEAYASEQGRKILKDKVTVLHCTTEYPAQMSSIRLHTMPQLGQIFDLSYGYSDHANGIAVSIAATALGASLIEKHFTLDKNMEGPDHRASLEPSELRSLISGIREVEQAIGGSRKVPSAVEIENRVAARKSLVALEDIRRGERFSASNLTTKRPGNGLSPFQYWDLIGTEAQADFGKDELIASSRDLS